MQIVSLGDNLHETSKTFSVKNKKNIINLLSADFAHRMVMIKVLITTAADKILRLFFFCLFFFGE